MCAKLHPPDDVDEIYPRAGAPVFKCWTGGSPLCCSGIFAAREQHCSCMHNLTLKDAVNFFFFGVGNLSDFRLENAEVIKPVKHSIL